MFSSACVPPDPHTTLHQLWEVMSNEESALQIDRQIILLETFLSGTGDSFDLADLDILCNVTTFLMKKEECNKSYNMFLHRIMDILKHPPTMKKASDELTYKHFLVNMFSTLGCLLVENGHEEFKPIILEILLRMIKLTRPKSSNWVRTKTCVDAIELSDLIACLSDFIVISDENIFHWVVYTTLQICLESTLSCWALLMRNGIDALLVRMITVQNRWQVMDTAFELFWKLFSCTSNPKDWVLVSPPSKVALQGLRYFLRESVLERAPVSPNNISAVILKLMQLFPAAEYGMSGLLEDIAYFVTMSERLRPQSNVKDVQDHFQFKKLLMACLSLSPTSPFSKETLNKYKVANCIVNMLSLENSSDSKVFWTSEQILELFQCALQVVCALLESFQEEFIDAGIIPKLLIFLEVHHTNDGHPIEGLVHSVVGVLTSLCCGKASTESTRNILREQGAIRVVFKACECILKPGYSWKIRSQSMLFRSLLVLATLVENKTELQLKYAEQSFFIVRTLYERVLKPLPTDSLIDNRLTVALLNYLWEVLVWNRNNVLGFISSGGIFSLLDILERSSVSVQMVCLSVLADICEYHQSVPYLVTWRGSGGVKLLSVLCAIWREEEERIGVPRSKDSCITDIQRPLMGEEQFILMQVEKNKLASTCDIYGSSRPKIYAIVQLMQRHKDVTEMCEEHYRLNHGGVPWRDMVTLQLIKAYLPLKMGEVWWEIRSKQEAVMPLDVYLAQTLSDRYLKWTLSVQQAQLQLVESLQKESLGKNDHTPHLASALEALREIMTIALTTDRQLRLSYWRRMKDSIQASRPCWVTQDLKPRVLGGVLVINKDADVVLQQDADVT